jgi:hypothetical protein
MCPICLVTAVLLAGKVVAAGGVAAITIKKLGGKNAVDNNPAPKIWDTEDSRATSVRPCV